MQFLVLRFPLVVAVLATGLQARRAELRLLRIVRGRHPGEIEAARGRARRRYDGPEELVLGLRRRLFARLREGAATTDRELDEALARAERADRIFRRATLVGAVLSAALLAAARFWLATPPP